MIRNFKGEVEEFRAVLGTMSEQRESKDQYKKFGENPKQYILRVLYNPEYIMVLIRYLKDLTTVLNTSITTELSEKYDKYPIMVMIQTEDIKQFVKISQPYGKT